MRWATVAMFAIGLERITKKREEGGIKGVLMEF